ncbi:MAG TPA: potassium-transporting ATPase subunit KdpA [Armatimonadota bacterium]|jgi:K+-transporting ATPase ATPase A chain
MTGFGLAEILLFFGVLLLLTRPLGAHLARVFSGERTWLHPVLRPVERALYRLAGIDEQQDMHWTTYGAALLAFSLVGGLFTYALLRLQGIMPLNPQGFSGQQMTPDLAFNTAVSFLTNTNWQSYAPESTVSYFSNMVPLALHNWLSAAAGIAVAIAVVRGFARHSAEGLGNLWVDVTRATLYVLLPLCLVYALFLVTQGVPQNFAPYVQATTLEGATQTIPQGLVASQEAIKMLGTNGGGLFNANSAHPYENPTPLNDLVQILSIFLIPAGLTWTFGKLVGNPRQGWALFGAMTLMFALSLSVCYWAESQGTPALSRLGVQTAATGDQPGGNMEGKEVRNGIAASALFATVTTSASCGAVNSQHDSFTPLGGGSLLINLMCDEVIFGGVGAGLFGMLMYAVVAVFIAGLMVGRTPEYVGKKIEQYEVRMAILAVLILVAGNLFWTALATNLNLPPTAAWNHVNGSSPSLYEGATYNNVNNAGAHGFTEIIYAYCSATANNGSAFAGITANTPYYNLTLGLAMLVGRFLMIIPLLAMAGALVRKKVVPPSAGTLATDTVTFAVLLAAIVLVVGALEYFPTLALGPIVEHFQMLAGNLF